jgi:hypothetical protein
MRAMVMVTPARLDPGMTASDCASPIMSAFPQVRWFRRLIVSPKRSPRYRKIPKIMKAQPMTTGAQQYLDAQPRRHDGYAGDHDHRRQARALIKPSDENARDAAKDHPDLAAQVDDHGEQRADMNGDIDRQPLI